MQTLFTSKQSTKEAATYHVKPGSGSGRNTRHAKRALLVWLPVFLLGGLSVLFFGRTILTSISPSISQSTTCAELMSSADYPQAVGLRSPQQEMAAVQLDDGLAGNSPAALVQVTNHNAQNTLDVYVFGCTRAQNKPALTRLFALQGLIHGSAKLTPDHTLVTEGQDTRISGDMLSLLQPLQQNVYHEYAWQRNGFVQIPFPGFYPVTSRDEAEILQQTTSHQPQLPWNNPVRTALQMSKDLLRWSPAPQAQLLSHTGDTAVVALSNQHPRAVLVVTLKQLVQPGSMGTWFVTDARTQGMLLTQAGTLDQPLASSVSSPMTFGGANALVDGQATATLFDHTLTPVGQATNVPVKVQPDSSYSGTLTYANLASGQQGVLLIESLPQSQNDATESAQILLAGVILK